MRQSCDRHAPSDAPRRRSASSSARRSAPAELHAAYLDAIAERDPELHCFLRTVDEPNGTGIPIALKDVISTKGVETTAGSRS